jgi:hypothetical protein
MSVQGIQKSDFRGGERMDLYSPFPPAECIRRLSEAMDVQKSAFFSLAGRNGSRPVTGVVRGLSVRLRKRIPYRSSFQTFLTATFEPDDRGAHIDCKFAMHPFTRWFMRAWMTMSLIIGSMVFVVSVGALVFASSPPRGGAWMGLVIPVALPIFGYCLFKFGSQLARDEARCLTDFLRETLSAGEKPCGR